MIQPKDNKGNIYIISAPSGTGKNTVINGVLINNPGLKYSVSMTTRKKRIGEVEGKSYYFASIEEFEKKIKKKEFIEWARVHGNYYGTLKVEIDAILAQGKDAILDIDVKGAIQFRNKMQNAFFIFITPPSISILKERLIQRGTDDPLSIKIRMQNSLQEIHEYYKFDYVIINEKLDIAIEDLKCIIRSNRLQSSNFSLQNQS